ncbi:MAG: ATP-binding protein [Spirochaetia bacterium]
MASTPSVGSAVDEISFPFYVDSDQRPDFALVLLLAVLVYIGVAAVVQYVSSVSQSNQLQILKLKLAGILDVEGEITDRVEITQFDEIGELTDKINRLMDKLNKRTRLEQELRFLREKSERSLVTAQRVGQLGSFEIDLKNGITTSSDQLYQMLSIDPADIDSGCDVQEELIHPADQQFVAEQINRAIEAKGSYTIPEYRIVRPDGGERLFQQQGEVATDDTGVPAWVYGAVLDITERKKVEDELVHKETELRAAEAASRAKSAFLANMSHELRTPLNSVIAASDILLEKYFRDLTDKQEEYLTDIRESGSHLLSLINDILDLSKIEAGYSPLEIEEVDLSSLLTGSLGIVREKALKHGIQLSCEVPDDLPHIQADERKVKQVAYNLLSNAVKFTPDGGNVGIIGRVEEEHVEICVWDTGLGIAEEDLEGIFGEFTQAEATLTRRYEGTGLGLALVKRFVEQHGGTLWVESKLGEGSKFFFTLPVRES